MREKIDLDEVKIVFILILLFTISLIAITLDYTKEHRKENTKRLCLYNLQSVECILHYE